MRRRLALSGAAIGCVLAIVIIVLISVKADVKLVMTLAKILVAGITIFSLVFLADYLIEQLLLKKNQPCHLSKSQRKA